jgi:hypothetical protein
MFGILAVLCFALSFLFHGFKFSGNSWIDATSLLYLGLVFLALHLLGFAVAVVERIRTRN